MGSIFGLTDVILMIISAIFLVLMIVVIVILFRSQKKFSDRQWELWKFILDRIIIALVASIIGFGGDVMLKIHEEKIEVHEKLQEQKFTAMTSIRKDLQLLLNDWQEIADLQKKGDLSDKAVDKKLTGTNKDCRDYETTVTSNAFVFQENIFNKLVAIDAILDDSQKVFEYSRGNKDKKEIAQLFSFTYLNPLLLKLNLGVDLLFRKEASVTKEAQFQAFKDGLESKAGDFLKEYHRLKESKSEEDQKIKSDKVVTNVMKYFDSIENKLAIISEQPLPDK